jgi:hypothetical protein
VFSSTDTLVGEEFLIAKKPCTGKSAGAIRAASSGTGTSRGKYTIPPILQLRLLESNSARRENEMLIIILVVLLVLSLGSAPAWPYSRNWGYYPSGGLGLVVVILLILLLLGRI